MNKKGFTLTEMLTVVLIIGVLTAVAVPQYRRTIQRTRATEAVAMLKVLADSAERLASSFGYKTVDTFATDASDKFVFQRLDMIDAETIPCAFNDTTMGCEYFTYTLNGDGTITAKQKNPVVELTIHPDEPSVNSDYITCTEPEGVYFCDLYGYGADTPEE